MQYAFTLFVYFYVPKFITEAIKMFGEKLFT